MLLCPSKPFCACLFVYVVQAKLEQAKLAAKVMNVATPGSSFAAGSADELKSSNTQTELKAMQKGLGECVVRLSAVSAQGEGR
jgi:hypothetical protein